MSSRSRSWIETVGDWIPGWPRRHNRRTGEILVDGDDKEIEMRVPKDIGQLSVASAPARVNERTENDKPVRATSSAPKLKNVDTDFSSDDDSDYYDFRPSVGNRRAVDRAASENRPEHSTPNGRTRATSQGEYGFVHDHVYHKYDDRGDHVQRSKKNDHVDVEHRHSIENRNHVLGLERETQTNRAHVLDSEQKQQNSRCHVLGSDENKISDQDLGPDVRPRNMNNGQNDLLHNLYLYNRDADTFDLGAANQQRVVPPNPVTGYRYEPSDHDRSPSPRPNHDHLNGKMARHLTQGVKTRSVTKCADRPNSSERGRVRRNRYDTESDSDSANIRRCNEKYPRKFDNGHRYNSQYHDRQDESDSDSAGNRRERRHRRTKRRNESFDCEDSDFDDRRAKRRSNRKIKNDDFTNDRHTRRRDHSNDNSDFDEHASRRRPRHHRSLSQRRHNRKQRDPEKFDGQKIEWPDYHKHFETVANWNGWSLREMAMQLVMSLQGEALMALGDLPDEIQTDYRALVSELTRRFNPAERETAYRVEFRNRYRRSNETAMQFGYALKRLANKAFPSMTLSAQEQWVMDQFVAGLSNHDLRKHVQFGHPKSLNEAISLAIEYEAFDSSSKDKVRKPISGEICQFEASGGNNAGRYYNNQSSQERRNDACFYCKEIGHYKRDCPKLRRKYNAGPGDPPPRPDQGSSDPNQGN